MSVQGALEDRYVTTRDIKKGEVLRDGDFEYIPPGIGFGRALSLLKDGGRVRRRGWNGKGMWVELARDVEVETSDGRAILAPFLLMRSVQGFVPWLASQTDLLTDDWEVAS
jgi:hypothetical protein